MDLKDLIAISGYPGLFRFITQGRNAIIVESLEDKKRISAYSSSKMSTLEEIAVFTRNEELPLADVLKKMYSYSEGKEALPHKSPNDEIKKYFEAVLPEYDRDRVYVSDMKKIVHWYNLLVRYGLLEQSAEDARTDDVSDDDQNKDKEKDKEKVSGEDKNPEVSATKKTDSFTRKKGEGHSGKTGMNARNQTGKAIRMPRKT